MDIHDVDLNLLVVFDAMARLGSVNRTAETIGLSQPATSAALARLRRLFDDALFVRAAGRMQPTPRAQALAPAVRRVIEAIDRDILSAAPFDPAKAERRFTVLTPDIGEVAFLPGVLRRLAEEAPLVRLGARSMPPRDAAEALADGEADLAVGFFPDLQKAGFFRQNLFRTSYAAIACARHRAGARAQTLAQFLALPHVIVRPDGREHTLDRFLEAAGHHRRVVLELSHFMSLAAILPGTDLVATVPADIATVIGQLVPIRRLKLPFAPPVIQVEQYWHRRMHEDPGHRWLRGVFHAVNRRDRDEGIAGRLKPAR